MNEVIPAEMRERDQWVLWKYDVKDGEPTKVPYHPTGYRASSTDPQTWSTYSDCKASVERFEGLGFVFSDTDDLIGIDLDGCRNTSTGAITPWAQDILDRCHTYCEVSPSQTGLKFFGKRNTKWKHKHKVKVGEHDGISKRPAVEVYDCERFFAVTGQAVNKLPIVAVDEALDWVADTHNMRRKEYAPVVLTPTVKTNAVERASKYVATMPPAISGSHGHDAAFNVACVLMKGFELSIDEARSIFVQEYNPRCQPPWSDKDIEHKLQEGAKCERDTGWLLNAEIPRTEGVDISRILSQSVPEKPTKPEVLVSLNEGYVANQVVRHLGKLGWSSDWLPRRIQDSVKVYVRGGLLVQAFPSEDPNTNGLLQIRQLPSALVRERITQACRLVIEKEENDGTITIHGVRPEKWLVDAIHHRGTYDGRVNPLVGVIQAPTIRPDGSILQDAGYDRQTGLLYRPNVAFQKISDKPTKEDAKKALASLFDVVRDFPFVDESDKAGWVAMVLSMLGRACVSGCVPLFAITATCPGSGKGLLADAAAQIAYGHPVSKREMQVKEEELSKFVTTVLFEGQPCHVFDNLDRTLRGATLDAVITSTSWKDRLLGSTKSTGDMPARTIWIATGNNIQYGSDTARRVLPIRLSPAVEDPESRTDFEHKNLIAWISENRAKLVVDGLTILRAFYLAGQPVDETSWGSFESWTKAIRGAVMFAGGADPLRSRVDAVENDDSKELVRRIFAAFEEADRDGKGMTVREIEAASKFPEQCPLLVAVISEICRGLFVSKRFSAKLRAIEGRVVDRKRLEKQPAGKGVMRWRVVEVGLVGLFQPKLTRGEKSESHCEDGSKLTNLTHLTHPEGASWVSEVAL